MVLIGLAQRFLKEDLAFRADGPARGTVLEAKEERGLGMPSFFGYMVYSAVILLPIFLALTALLSVVSTNWMLSAGIMCRLDSTSALTIAPFDLMASDPPLSRMLLPDLMQTELASAVTLGLDS